jgi:thiosulfate reductase cytochrome b subunit
MTLSNTAVAVFPWLIALFDGRQSARTLHFIGAMSLLLFFHPYLSGLCCGIRE